MRYFKTKNPAWSYLLADLRERREREIASGSRVSPGVKRKSVFTTKRPPFEQMILENLK